MLPRAQRLTARRDFSRVYNRGKQYRAPLVTLYALRRDRPTEGGEPRFGISVSKKVGGAVQRNLVKRRLREACRVVSREGSAGLDYVLVARPGAAESSYHDLVTAVQTLVRKAGSNLGGSAPPSPPAVCSPGAAPSYAK